MPHIATNQNHCMESEIIFCSSPKINAGEHFDFPAKNIIMLNYFQTWNSLLEESGGIQRTLWN